MGYAGVSRRDMHLNEEEEDLADAISPIYDQLSLKWRWWLLELLPMQRRVQGEDGKWTEQTTYVPSHAIIWLKLTRFLE